MFSTDNHLFSSNSYLQLDKKLLIRNIQTIFKFINRSKQVKYKLRLAPCLKSNAYGHGLLPVARVLDTLKEVEFLTVFSTQELLALKQENIAKKILVIGFWQTEVLEKLAASNYLENVHLSCSNFEDLQFLANLSRQQQITIKVHIFLDTGMHREGFLISQLDQLIEEIKKLKKEKFLKIVGLMTHFATSEEDISKTKKTQTEKNQNRKNRFLEQQKKFTQAIQKFKEQKIYFTYFHQDNSGAVLQIPHNFEHINCINLIRPGLLCYGYLPNQQLAKYKLLSKIQPILSWKTRIAQIKIVRKNEYIGYGNDYQVDQNILIAILPVGYADGLARNINLKKQKPYVLIADRKYYFIGKICMNLSMIKLGKLDEKCFSKTGFKIGQIVTLLGQDQKKSISLEEFAKWQETIPYEALIKLNPFLNRQVIKSH